MTTEIHPCLWFDGQAQAAATFYCNLFPNSKILVDSGLVVNFELNGKLFMALNGGDYFKINEAVSFVISCENQAEIDYYWNALTQDGGQESNCGWCKDKFGVSWQVVPSILSQLMADSNKRDNVVKAFMKMKKFDIAALESA